MKKFKLIVMMMAVVGLFATSCSKDDDTTTPVDKSPTLNFKGDAGYVSQDATVTLGDTIKIGVLANSNKTSNAKLVSVKYEIIANNTVIHTDDSTFKAKAYDYDYMFPVHQAVDFTVKFTVTDKKDEKTSKSIKVTVKPLTTDLPEAAHFKWERIGAVATGLEPFGLKWEQNAKEVKAKIVKETATKLVKLAPADWTNITTVEDLQTAIEAGKDMDAFHEISAEATNTYDIVLGIALANGGYSLVHITNANVSTNASGTTVTITGGHKTTNMSK